MTRVGSAQRCAYIDCKKTTDKRSFGHSHALSDAQLSLYSPWLKPEHDGVVCNCHYTLLRRLLAKQSLALEESAARMEALLSAPAIVDSLASSPSLPSPSSTVIVSIPPLTTLIQAQRSSSLPEVPTTSSAPSTPPALRRSPSAPLLRPNQRGATRQQRHVTAMSCALSGATWTMWNRLEANANACSMRKSTWYALTEQVWQTILAVKADRETAYTEQLLTANQPIVVAADGAWSHPGYVANQHDWVLMNCADKHAIFSIPLYRTRRRKGRVVHEGNYDDGSSKGMEGYALDIAINKLQATGLAALISGWVGDQDSSVLKQLRACPAARAWQVHLDPGHAKKNLRSSLNSLLGDGKEFDGLAKRIPVFIMRLTKRAEKEHAGNVAEMRSQFLLWMDFVVPHYTGACSMDCPHHQRDGDEYEEATVDSTPKTYLNPTKHAGQITGLHSLIDRMKASARYLIHGHNTCSAERYHRERLKATPKLYEFWSTWAPRCALNQLLHNEGSAETHRLVLAKLDAIPWGAGRRAR